MIRTISETEHFIILDIPFDAFYGGQEHKNEFNRHLTLNICEQIFQSGYEPLFYENRQMGFVCRKSLKQVKEWNDKLKSEKAA